MYVQQELDLTRTILPSIDFCELLLMAPSFCFFVLVLSSEEVLPMSGSEPGSSGYRDVIATMLVSPTKYQF